MRVTTAIGFVCVLALRAFAQGAMNFRADLDGTHAVTPNLSLETAKASLTLSPDNHFEGTVITSYWLPVNSVEIFRSSAVTDLGMPLFTLGSLGSVPPFGGPGGEQVFGISSTLTAAQASEVSSGLWWAVVNTPGYPNGELRGQISAVPEPSIYALILFGIAGISAFRARTIAPNLRPPPTNQNR